MDRNILGTTERIILSSGMDHKDKVQSNKFDVIDEEMICPVDEGKVFDVLWREGVPRLEQIS